MTTKNFTVKISRIRNKKDSEYFVYRTNIPKTIAEELKLEDKDRIFCKIKKAEWYHPLDWSTMKTTWDRLPLNLQKEIQKDGLLEGTDLHVSELAKFSIGTGFISDGNKMGEQNLQNIGTG